MNSFLPYILSHYISYTLTYTFVNKQYFLAIKATINFELKLWANHELGTNYGLVGFI